VGTHGLGGMMAQNDATFRDLAILCFGGREGNKYWLDKGFRKADYLRTVR